MTLINYVASEGGRKEQRIIEQRNRSDPIILLIFLVLNNRSDSIILLILLVLNRLTTCMRAITLPLI